MIFDRRQPLNYIKRTEFNSFNWNITILMVDQAVDQFTYISKHDFFYKKKKHSKVICSCILESLNQTKKHIRLFFCTKGAVC